LQTITWTSEVITGNVKIELMQGATVNKLIETSTLNTGTYAWLIPEDLVTGVDYKIKITSLNSSDVFDESDSFTITSTARLINTTAATAITQTTATLNGTVNANGFSTTVTFEYGPTTAYGQTINATPATVAGSTSTSVFANITFNDENTTCHFRVKAVNESGTTYGEDMVFSTARLINTTAATAITQTTATLNGIVNANGFSTTVTFEYGPTTAYGQTIEATPATVNGNTATNVLANITGLTANATYHFRVKAVNGEIPGYGTDLSFITSAAIQSTSLDVLVMYEGTADPVANCSVTLFASQSDWQNLSNPITSGTTDQTGRIVFSGLNPAIYYIDAYRFVNATSYYSNELLSYVTFTLDANTTNYVDVYIELLNSAGGKSRQGGKIENILQSGDSVLHCKRNSRDNYYTKQSK